MKETITEKTNIVDKLTKENLAIKKQNTKLENAILKLENKVLKSEATILKLQKANLVLQNKVDLQETYAERIKRLHRDSSSHK